MHSIEPDLIRLGERYSIFVIIIYKIRVLGDIFEYGREADRNPPQLIHYDAWGNRIDDVSTLSAGDLPMDKSM